MHAGFIAAEERQLVAGAWNQSADTQILRSGSIENGLGFVIATKALISVGRS